MTSQAAHTALLLLSMKGEQVNRPKAEVGLRLFGLQVSNWKMDILVLYGFTDSKVSVFFY